MGVGTFNLMISLLPARVIRLLEFIGFSGNKQIGINDLKIGHQMDGIRKVLCVMTLLAYNLIVCYVLSHQEGDLKLCDEILKKQLQVSSAFVKQTQIPFCVAIYIVFLFLFVSVYSFAKCEAVIACDE